MMKKNWKSLPVKLFNFLIISFSCPSLAEKNYLADETPQALENIKIIEHLGQLIDLDLHFVNERNQSLSLKHYFADKPVLMSIVYYNCPSLCNFHLNGLFESLEKVNTPRQVVIVSMDETETPSLAKEKKSNYLKKFKKLKADHIHFLTGSKASIQKLSDKLGFAFRWDEETKQFAHSPVAYALSSKGMISRYLYGVQFEPKTLKLSLLSAGKGKVGNIIDRILLFCYRFNPEKNKYTLYARNIMKAGGVLIILALMSLLIPVWLKERRQHT